ncbi:MAG TPA: ATP-binding cassette domain-containing protein, partial [Anaerolineales bacterium]|nr:ATP-binding cassette domain-containing protein [Anaerolineales bacterium]
MQQSIVRVQTSVTAVPEETTTKESLAPKLSAKNLSVFYGTFRAVTDINMDIQTNKITAIIGPSGCGKSTLLRSFNRMNDLTPGARVEGEIVLDGKDINTAGVDVVDVRRRIGMVFQRPNPF